MTTVPNPWSMQCAPLPYVQLALLGRSPNTIKTADVWGLWQMAAIVTGITDQPDFHVTRWPLTIGRKHSQVSRSSIALD